MTLRSVCVFCGASPGASPVYQEAAVALGRHLAERGLTLVYGGGAVGLMGTVADAALRRRRSDRDHPAEPAGGRDRPQGPDPPGSGRRHARAQGTHGRTGRRLHRPARRARHPGRAVRGLDLGPTGLPRQAAGPARSERFLRPAADFPRPPGRRTFRPRRTPRHAAAQRQRRALLDALAAWTPSVAPKWVDRTRSDPLLSQDGGSRLSGSSGRPFWRISKYSCTRSASEEPASAIFWPLPTICPSFTSKRLLCA